MAADGPDVAHYAGGVVLVHLAVHTLECVREATSLCFVLVEARDDVKEHKITLWRM